MGTQPWDVARNAQDGVLFEDFAEVKGCRSDPTR